MSNLLKFCIGGAACLLIATGSFATSSSPNTASVGQSATGAVMTSSANDDNGDGMASPDEDTDVNKSSTSVHVSGGGHGGAPMP